MNHRSHRADRSRRVAVALAVAAVVVAAAQLLTGWAIHTDRVPLRDPLYLDKLAAIRERPAFRSANDEPLAVLFVGSSRTLVAVDAGAVGPALSTELGRPVEAFNFGTAGAGPVTCAVYLRRLLADGVKPDAVVIEVLPALLASQGAPPESKWLPAIRLRPHELPGDQENLYLGHGFEWTQQHAQRCVDASQPDAKPFVQPSKRQLRMRKYAQRFPRLHHAP